jgi:hypothetical protein
MLISAVFKGLPGLQQNQMPQLRCSLQAELTQEDPLSQGSRRKKTQRTRSLIYAPLSPLVPYLTASHTPPTTPDESSQTTLIVCVRRNASCNLKVVHRIVAYRIFCQFHPPLPPFADREQRARVPQCSSQSTATHEARHTACIARRLRAARA